MTKLSDTQSILLSAASQREDGSVFPVPTGVVRGGGLTKAVTALMKRELVEERQTGDVSQSHRMDGDLGYGVYITATGLAAIGVDAIDPPVGAGAAGDIRSNDGPAEVGVGDAPVASTAKAPSKTAAVLALLARPQGATLTELIEMTGWLPHTTRAALTGIRKKGHDVARIKRDGVTCYRIAGQTEEAQA